MSGRIRSIKPELLEDVTTAGLSSDAFRLFIGCILAADDYGRLRSEPEQLYGLVFWKIPPLARPSRDPRESLEVLLRELQDARLLVPYVRDGQRYSQIRTWSKHQKVDHPGKSRIPAPSEEEMGTLARPSRDPRETLAPDLRSGSGPSKGLEPSRDLTPDQTDATTPAPTPAPPDNASAVTLDDPITSAALGRVGTIEMARGWRPKDVPGEWMKYVGKVAVKRPRSELEGNWQTWLIDAERYARREAERDAARNPKDVTPTRYREAKVPQGWKAEGNSKGS